MTGAAIANFLSVVAMLVKARGAEPDVIEIIETGAKLVKAGGNVAVRMRELADRVQTMVDEGRGPTSAEMAALRNEREALSQRMRDVELPDDSTVATETDGGQGSQPGASEAGSAVPPAPAGSVSGQGESTPQ